MFLHPVLAEGAQAGQRLAILDTVGGRFAGDDVVDVAYGEAVAAPQLQSPRTTRVEWRLVMRPSSRRHSKAGRATCPLPTVADVNDVAVLNDVVLAFEEELAGFLELHFGVMAGVAGGDEVGVLHDFGANEASGKIGVNGVRSIHGGFAVTDRPRADFVFANGEEGDVAQRSVKQPGKNMNRGFLNAERREKLGAFGGILDLRDFGFDLRAQLRRLRSADR